MTEDRPRIRTIAVLLALLAGWIVWALVGRVSIVAISKRARFESVQAVRQIAIPMSGRVTAVNIALGQRVKHGDILLELDAADAAIRRTKALDDIAHAQRRIAAIEAQIDATEALANTQVHAAAAKLRQAGESRIEAAHLAEIESDRAARLTRLAQQGLVAWTDATDARNRAEAERARVRSLAAVEEEVAKEQSEAISTAAATKRALDNDRIELQAQVASSHAAVKQAEIDMERFRVRAPADGRIGTSAELRPGMWVRDGGVVASILPLEPMEVAAWFSLDDMPLLRNGQRATVWLDALGRGGRRRFAAKVIGIEHDPSGEDFRVTLRLEARPPANAAVDQGFPATVTVDVQRLSPFDAMLRVAGMIPTSR